MKEGKAGGELAQAVWNLPSNPVETMGARERHFLWTHLPHIRPLQ